MSASYIALTGDALRTWCVNSFFMLAFHGLYVFDMGCGAVILRVKENAA